MRPPSGRFIIQHAIPGRLRLRLPREADLDRVTGDLTARTGVLKVSASPVTGSVLIHFDPAQVQVESLAEVAAARSLRLEPAASGPQPGTVAEAVVDATGALDTRIKQATRGAVGLGALLPLGLLGWAASELARGRARPLPWTSAIWYAHSIFRDYNREAAREIPPRTGP